MTRSQVKNLILLLFGLALLVLAVALTLSVGMGLVPKISVWFGVLILLSLESSRPWLRRTLLYARLGLLLNVFSMLTLTLGKGLLISRGWYESPQAMSLFSQLQWLLNTLPTLLQNLVVNRNLGVKIFPEYQVIYFLVADYGNLLLQMLAMILLLWSGTLLWKGVRGQRNPVAGPR